MSLLSGLLGIGGSIISGLFGRKSQKDQINHDLQINRENLAEHRVTRDMMIAEARRAEKYNRAAVLGDRAFTASSQLAAEKRAADRALAAEKRGQAYQLAAEQRGLGYENTRVQRLVADAKAAGIHPLAALGSQAAGSIVSAGSVQPIATGASGTQGGAASAVSPEFETYRHTGSNAYQLSPMGDAIGDAMAQLGNMQQAGLNARLTEAQIRNVEASTKTMLADATSRTLVARARSVGSNLGTAQLAVSSPGGSVQDFKYLPDITLPHGPKGAQVAEDALGELGEVGIVLDSVIDTLVNDLARTQVGINMPSFGRQVLSGGRSARIGATGTYKHPWE